MKNKYLIFLVILLAGFIGLKIYFRLKDNKDYGTVIILNGPSASGKSSIQKEFQKLMMFQPAPKDYGERANLWIKLGIDSLFDGPMPDITLENLEYWQSPNPIRWVETTKDKDDNSVITLKVGPEGERVAYGMNSAIAQYAKAGNNAIVDYIAYKKEWIDDLQSKLKDIKTVWVKVNIPLSVLEEREVARGTSPKGHARSHYDKVFWDIKYDIEVHTDKQDAKQIALEIREYISK